MDGGFERPGDDAIEVIELDEPSRGGQTAFGGRTGRRSALIRVAAVLGTAGALVLSAALTMAASPAPSATSGAPASPGAPRAPNGNGSWAGPQGMMGGAFGHGPMNGPGRGFAMVGGITITAIDGSRLSLRTTDGWTRTIVVASTTKITKAGQAVSLADLRVGDQVVFQQSRGSDGTFVVTAIQVALPHVEGTVAAVTGDGFSMTSPDGSTTRIVVNGSTTYRVGPGGAGSKADVKAGARVAVEGTRAADGTITATTVRVAPAMVAGQVTAKTSGSITVRLPGGTTTTVRVSSSTSFRVAGKSAGSLADIAVGDRIAAEGTQNADGSLQATSVATMGAGWGWGRGARGPGGSMPGPGGPMGGPMQGPGGQGAPGFEG